MPDLVVEIIRSLPKPSQLFHAMPGPGQLTMAPACSFSNLSPSSHSWFLVILSSLHLSQDPVTKHEPLKHTKRQFNSPIIHNDFQGANTGATRPSLLMSAVRFPILI